VEAVIITGGKGTRLAPYTRILPKGLLPIGNQPILEIIVKQLAYYGFNSITMACGHLAPLIQTYFGDGRRFNVAIRYQIEDQPLGTAGPIKLLEYLDEPFLVTNCDVLTTLDFGQLHRFHCSGTSPLTIASQKKNIPIDLGVLETEGERVTRFLEKPTHAACVNMGIYMMDPEIIKFIPNEQFFDIPDLFQALLSGGKEIRHYLNNEFWMDIGRPADYQLAEERYNTIKNRLLPGEQEGENQ
jgi:NDP-sugar pyrophosphorylase family protein